MTSIQEAGPSTSELQARTMSNISPVAVSTFWLTSARSKCTVVRVLCDADLTNKRLPSRQT
eukprot:CAMPEP_0115762530 /NCGR_PEP_ID=MMETSP0272-20121206/101074_1 /TAXON_ID=71861 /ORGANISM="Scrippsiella trochoidea, Strain CCMP3099" /LENGTH=60 /DNA_ID=CAMNT_0003208253 /DNA_START=415 /DNA_END=597 /DNA_ORIENTATION=-